MKRITIICTLFALAPMCVNAQMDADADRDGDVGLWMEAGITKKLSRQWSVGGGLEMRLGDDVSYMSRLGLGATVNYKPLSWMRLSTGYEWIYGRKDAADKPDLNKAGQWNGYNYKHSVPYSASRHRVRVEMALQAPKLWRCIRLSARLRYQYTWRPELNIDRWQYKFYSKDKAPVDAWDELTDDGDIISHPAEAGHKAGELKPGYPEYDPKVKDSESSHYLRSRIKAEYERKRCPWNPFVSYEFYNDLSTRLTMVKTRLGVGSGYKISKQHEVGIAYLYCTEYGDVEPGKVAKPDTHSHVINISYEFKF